MIQDIAPHRYRNEYRPETPTVEDRMLIYSDNKILMCINEQDGIEFPKVGDLQSVVSDVKEKAKYLFKIDDKNYYELRTPIIEAFDKWNYESLEMLRHTEPLYKAFAGITGFQIHKFYDEHAFCGRCGTKMKPQGSERAMMCPSCGKVVYPTISPSVIVAVLRDDKILLTKYQSTHSKYRNYALIAGYAEVGETLEETVKREVMEEVGLKVTNIRYYKSQPWSFSDTLLVGFFCEADGDDEIVLEADELSEGKWFTKEELPDNRSGARISLTGEMIEVFRRGNIGN